MASEVGISGRDLFMYNTVRIACELKDGKGISTGTGFLFSYFANERGGIPVIVSNKHVIAGSARGIFHFHQAIEAGRPLPGQYISCSMENFEDAWIMHPDPTVDLCIMPVAGAWKQLDERGMHPFYVIATEADIPDAGTFAALSPLEDIVMVGYPNGIWDEANNFPVVRRGITATKPSVRYQGKDEFLIDIPVFGGSSGSPVYLYNDHSFRAGNDVVVGRQRLLLVGILYAVHVYQASGEIQVREIPTGLAPVPVTSLPLNLGLVISSQRLRDFVPLLHTRLSAEDSSELKTTQGS